MVVNSRCAAPGKARDEIARKATSENVRAYAHNRSGIEHGVDAAFRMVAHHQVRRTAGRLLRTRRFRSSMSFTDS